jgi:hypothetical protein
MATLFRISKRAILIAGLVSCYAFGDPKVKKLSGGTCTGNMNCTACKNCKYCKHCSMKGGSCGVCFSKDTEAKPKTVAPKNSEVNEKIVPRKNKIVKPGNKK